MSSESNLNQTFQALADPTRRAIMARLANGEASVNELAAPFDISLPAISRHLKVLREAGILHRRVDKQRRMYSVRPEAVQAISDWSMTYREFWQKSFDRLGAALLQESEKH